MKWLGPLWFGAALCAADEKKIEDPIEKLAEQARKSIVVISSADREGVRSGTGTGFVVSEDGIIATNFHVIGQHRGFSVRFPDGKTYEPTAILATDRKHDLQYFRPLLLGRAGISKYNVENAKCIDFCRSHGPDTGRVYDFVPHNLCIRIPPKLTALGFL